MWRHAVVPVDGTPHSLRVLEAACAFQRVFGMAIDAVYVIEVPRALPLSAELPALRSKAEAVMAEVRAVAEREGAVVRQRIIQARALGAAIIEAAAEGDVLMVAGRATTRFNSPWGEDLASFLFRKAPTAVLLFRDPRVGQES
ncbi:MAG: universal stress protein [Actinomycetia bacterium]|nr:universal stress protein [Actinomycetes bacterium]